MKMLTKELESEFAKQGYTDGKGEEKTQVLAHYFAGSWDWWATEYDPKDRIFFGLVKGFEVELGSFSLDEIEQNSCNVKPLGGVERDLYWKPKSLAEVRRGIEENGR
ncbi:MAG: hypothetical protein A2X34_09735 [Elusimicrobia bacterium GWC2_51_8]|nr:MAG: hypothetical protein A2X33_10185 [Elusimicrobia bacterium GWA2_51_34]OGR61145.1 MAG: hypothetical protein A2X34_09735 [Elusimicrobia bacterium GWC2_51_8]OGR84731.1 MAG: hypothetical protein A2021_03900 [Elusimicrobia bacterium GWF2_52_66]